MFNWKRISQQVADYTFGTDKFVGDVCDRLYEINPEAQSLDDFEYDVFYDVLMEVDEWDIF